MLMQASARHQDRTKGVTSEEEMVNGLFVCAARWTTGVVYSIESVKVLVQWEVTDVDLCNDTRGFTR